jgi:hypothetical protein
MYFHKSIMRIGQRGDAARPVWLIDAQTAQAYVAAEC